MIALPVGVVMGWVGVIFLYNYMIINNLNIFSRLAAIEFGFVGMEIKVDASGVWDTSYDISLMYIFYGLRSISRPFVISIY